MNEFILDEDKVLQILGGYIFQWKAGRTKFHLLNEKENIIIRYSHEYSGKTGYWFGISPGGMSNYVENKVSLICFVLGVEGIVKVPIEIINKYIQNADKTHDKKKNVKHFHIRFRVNDDDSVKLFNKKEVFNVTDYMVPYEKVYMEIDKNEDYIKLMKEAKKFNDYDESYSGETVNKSRKESRRQKKIIARLENYTCQVCGFKCEFTNDKGNKLYIVNVDHIVEKSKGGGEKIDNLWVLCPNCHAKKTYGVITLDTEKKIVKENNNIINIRDNHLGW